MDMRKWFKEAQYGMMVHWGLYSLLAGEYKDRYSGVYAEWIQANLAIPNAEYGKLAKAFNPVFFDAEEWVKLAKDCGMKYFVSPASTMMVLLCSTQRLTNTMLLTQLHLDVMLSARLQKLATSMA